MTIKREINGVMTEIELTQQEAKAIFTELQTESLIASIKEHLEMWDDEFDHVFTEEEIRECAVDLRDRCDTAMQDDTWSDIIWYCINDYLQDREG